MFTPLLKTGMDFTPLKVLGERSPEMFKESMAKGGIQFLNWANIGSRRESRTPPIRWGVLRGSSSVFVDTKLVSVFKSKVKSGAPEGATPAKTNDFPKPLTLTFVWNTDYAAAMHEHDGNWGEATLRAGDAGNKWLELHMARDRQDLMEFIADDFIKRMDKMNIKVASPFLGTGRI